jgi:hypothetical protein
MPPVGFGHTISARQRPQTYALDFVATGTGFPKCTQIIYTELDRTVDKARYIGATKDVGNTGYVRVFCIYFILNWPLVFIELKHALI